MGRYLKASKVMRPRSALRTGRVPRSLLMSSWNLQEEELSGPVYSNVAVYGVFRVPGEGPSILGARSSLDWSPEEEPSGAWEEDEGARFDTLDEAWLHYGQELHLAQERMGEIWPRRVPTEVLDEWWEQEALHEELGDDFEIVMLMEEGPYSRDLFDPLGWS